MAFVGGTLRAAAYRSRQYAVASACVAAQELVRSATGNSLRGRRPRDIEGVRRRYAALLEMDLENAEQGLYPAELLRRFPMLGQLRRLPEFALDIPASARRKRHGDFRDLPDEATRTRYPAYYRRNYHWQTDGYFSAHSARIYDVGVELLFLGAADIMRRQVIPPITRLGREAPRESLRVLDLACGTGRTLLQLAQTHPQHSYYAVDLSPHYIREASQLLRDVPRLSLLVEDAAALPLRDESFDVVTCVFAFHEWPRRVRREVIAEMWRLLRPGGCVVIQDAAQREDGADIRFFLERFPKDFHEPFFEDYQGDPLDGILREQGFTQIEEQAVLFARQLVARR